MSARTIPVVAMLALLSGCAESDAPTTIDSAAKPPPDPGALVAVSAQSTVGVLLDEVPASMRDRVATALLAKPASFWKERALAQMRLTNYRLVFREFFYGGRKQLPLPPEPLLNITLTGNAQRDTNFGGHDVVKIPYSMSGTLLTDFESPSVSEPQLKNIGGVWNEPFVFPIDPELLLQRTGYDCMDEEDFPFNSVDSEEADSFFDQDCDVESGLSAVGQCHQTRQGEQSCVESLEANVGKVETQVRFERIPWNAATADAVRFGNVTDTAGADLEIYLPDFLPERVIYRYIHPSSCELVEACVGGSGWRRLLQFATSDENVGSRTLTIGGVDYTITSHSGELDEHNLFEYSACHNHYHFKYYGAFTWNGNATVNEKKGFCLQSTARTSNREGSPLHNEFGGCDYQGVEVGWVDQYKAGLPCQWLDITGYPAGVGTRSFHSNPNGFLCEGNYVDENGDVVTDARDVVWEDTGLVAEDGVSAVEKPMCALGDTWDANNEHSVQSTIPPAGDGLITTPCTRGQLGPLRNCGLKKPSGKRTCTPGATVNLSCRVPGNNPPQVARVCEWSHALDSPIPCKAEDSWVPLAPGVSDQPYTLANTVVSGSSVQVSFTCPSARVGGDAPEPGGAYSIYTGPVWPDDASANVQCEQVP